MYGGGAGPAGYGIGPGPSHYVHPPASMGYQLGPPPPPPPDVAPAGSQLLSYGANLSPHQIQQVQSEVPGLKRKR